MMASNVRKRVNAAMRLRRGAQLKTKAEARRTLDVFGVASTDISDELLDRCLAGDESALQEAFGHLPKRGW